MSNDLNNDSKSWGDTIRSYERNKKTLPWESQENQSMKTISLLERRTKEREVDPILMQYRDPLKESHYQTQTMKMQQEKTLALHQTPANQNRSKTIRSYNLITHTPSSTGALTSLTTSTHGTRGVPNDRNQRDYHLLSHYQTKLHSAAPLEYDESFTQSCVYKKPPHPKPHFRTREFNILSNHYSSNHSEKEAEDHRVLQEKMLKKYWETHHYDLLKGQNYQETDEMKYQEDKEKKRRKQLRRKEEQYPRSVVYAEGNTYNILSQEITHPDHFNTVQNETLNRSLHKFKAREVFQETVTQNSHQNEHKEEERKINRISFQRWERGMDRGYDPITNQKLSSTTLLPLTRRPATVWEKLHVPTNDSALGTHKGGQDLSQNHGNNWDWEIEGVSPAPAKNTQASTLTASKSLAQFPPTPSSNNDFLHKSSSTPLLKPMSSRENQLSNRAHTADTSSSRQKLQVPSLDLSRTSSSSINVRTGGLGEYM